MGVCNSKGYSRKFTLQELADLKINQTKEMQEGCGPCIDGANGGSCYDMLMRRGFGFPDNGEFTWGGLGRDCIMCSDAVDGYGCDNCGGDEGIGGCRGTVKRVAYNGNPTKCCINKECFVDGKYTCDPKYLKDYSDSGCDDVMLEYCKNGNREKDVCMDWVKKSIKEGRTVANKDMINYCSKNFGSKACQNWCSATRSTNNDNGNNKSMKYVCDKAVISYCKNNKNDPNCECINSSNSVFRIKNIRPCNNVIRII